MPTRVFLCWSGTRSRRLAEILATWLPDALGGRVETSMSTHIEKGAEWFEELLKALDNASCGILCLTPEALESRWIHFESGLLARALSQIPNTRTAHVQGRRVFPLLFGARDEMLLGPLASYQATIATDVDDVVRLVEAIWSLVPESEGEPVEDLRRGWRKRWTTLNTLIGEIPPVALKEVIPEFEELFRRKTFQERLHDCLSQDWIDRYNGARDTRLTLRAHAATVRQACRPFIADVFDEVVAALDSYAMGLSKLVGRPDSPIDPVTGELVFESPGLAIACERQRTKIRRLVSRLVDNRLAPVLDEAFRFEAAETFEEKKRLIHRQAAELERRHATLGATAADSDWDFDRVMYYVWQQERGDPTIPDALARTRLELEKVNSRTAGWSLMPLSYALGALEKAVSTAVTGVDPDAVSQWAGLARDIRAFIERTKTDAGAHVRTSVSRIEKLLTERVGTPPVPAAPGTAPA